MSEQQEAQIVAHFRQVIVALDGDEPGRRAAGEIAGRLVHKLYVRIADVPEGKQPD